MAAALAATLALFGCRLGSADLVVASKNFTEQDVLAELLAQWIERTTDLTVQRRLHLGGTFICHRALVAGEIDLYVEYTGTAFAAVLEHAPVPDADSVFRAVRHEYGDRFDLAWGEPLGFENSFAILVRRGTADSLGLRTISDAVPFATSWAAGFGYEFMERDDGFPGLRAAYGLEFATSPRVMELGLIYRALAGGEIDLTAGSSTDGLIDALGLVVLEDDRRHFPPYQAAPVVRRETLARHPQLAGALAELGGRISPAEIRAMNRAVDVDRRDFRAVARAWVNRELDPTGTGS